MPNPNLQPKPIHNLIVTLTLKGLQTCEARGLFVPTTIELPIFGPNEDVNTRPHTHTHTRTRTRTHTPPLFCPLLLCLQSLFLPLIHGSL